MSFGIRRLVKRVPQITPHGTPQCYGAFGRRNHTLLDIVWSMKSLIELLLFLSHTVESKRSLQIIGKPSISVETIPYDLWHGFQPRLSFSASMRLSLNADKFIFVVEYLRNQLGTFLMTKANLLPGHTILKKQYLDKGISGK